jgi:hypothetical protein
MCAKQFLLTFLNPAHPPRRYPKRMGFLFGPPPDGSFPRVADVWPSLHRLISGATGTLEMVPRVHSWYYGYTLGTTGTLLVLRVRSWCHGYASGATGTRVFELTRVLSSSPVRCPLPSAFPTLRRTGTLHVGARASRSHAGMAVRGPRPRSPLMVPPWCVCWRN